MTQTVEVQYLVTLHIDPTSGVKGIEATPHLGGAHPVFRSWADRFMDKCLQGGRIEIAARNRAIARLTGLDQEDMGD